MSVLYVEKASVLTFGLSIVIGFADTAVSALATSSDLRLLTPGFSPRTRSPLFRFTLPPEVPCDFIVVPSSVMEFPCSSLVLALPA